MTCNMDEYYLYAYDDGTIDPLEKIFVEEHLKHCSKCRKQLEIIKSIENGLSMIQFPVPDRLSEISQMVAENCIESVENKDSRVKRQNYRENMKSIGNIIIRSQFLKNNNPYNKAINKCVKAAVSAAEKPAKKYIRKKMAKFNLLKILKVADE
jgi:hypothetical protein